MEKPAEGSLLGVTIHFLAPCLLSPPHSGRTPTPHQPFLCLEKLRLTQKTELGVLGSKGKEPKVTLGKERGQGSLGDGL